MADPNVLDSATPVPQTPDLMNDPAYDGNNTSSEKNTVEGDTCRICRSEGTQEEPLFYPCRCSGSIKFVHQECLMEWLSHSQKKHCELCKTPFRFTKIYDPNTPQKISVTVFIRMAAVHLAKGIITWMRALLVISVWLIALPWCMRCVWGGLFWLADAGWARDAYMTRAQTLSADSYPSAHLALRASRESMAASAPNDQTTRGPYGFGFMKALFFGREAQNPHLPPGPETNAIIGNKTTLDIFSQRHSSLLSEISVLNSMTASPWLNRTIIDVLEGLIITLFVVVAFILVFLIREWVVQQQPLLALEPNAPLRNAPPLGAADAGHRPDPIEVERPVPNDGLVEGPLAQPLIQPARERQGSAEAEVPQERTNPHDAEVSTETEEADSDGVDHHEKRRNLTSMEHFVASYWSDDSNFDADEVQSRRDSSVRARELIESLSLETQKALQQSSVGRIYNIEKAIASLPAEDQYLLHKKMEEWEIFDLRLKRSELPLEDQLIPLQSMVLSHALIKDYGDVSGSNKMGKIAAELIDSLPQEAREILREALQTENDLSEVFEKLSAEDKELVREKVAEWCATLHAYNGSDQHTEAQPESSHALQRPAMPLRGESFKAAEIQRTLEEESTASDDPELSGVSHRLRDPDAEAEHDSVESDESAWSWQNVNDAEKAETQTSDPFPGSSGANLSSVDPPTGSRSEGKAKMKPEGARSDGLESESPLFNHDSETAPLTDSTTRPNAASSDSDSPHTSITGARESGGPPGSESSVSSNHTGEAASVAHDDSYWATPADASAAATTPENRNRLHGRTENPGERSIPVQPPAQEPIAAQQPLIDRFLDWFWGGVPAAGPAGNGAGEDEEHIVHELAEEAPFVHLPPADEPVDPGAVVPDPE
ncbi:hypothetical protein LTR16_003690, partial [Cryomyces antarcticus]